MALVDNTIAATSVELCNTMHTGDVLPILPIGGFTGSSHHDIVKPTGGYKVGSKVRYYDPSAKGWVTMVYIQVATVSGVAYAAGVMVGTAAAGDNASLYQWRMTNKPATGLLIPKGGSAAILISAMTAERYGWAWCAGPCPQVTRAGTSTLAAASISTYWDISSVTGAYMGVAGDASDIDTMALIVADADNQRPFGLCKVVCTAT